MNDLLLIAAVLLTGFGIAFLVCIACSPSLRDTVFHTLGAFTTRVIYLVLREPIVLDLHTRDYGHLGVRVYVSDELWATRIRAVTGNKTITERNIRALAGLGYQFTISSPEPMSIPMWLIDYIDNDVAMA